MRLGLKLLVVPIRLIDERAVSEARRVLTSAFHDFEVTPIEEPYIPRTEAYDEVRGQWRADAVAYGLVTWARRTHGCGDRCMVLGVSPDDGYVPGLNFVFGIALPPTGSAAIFTYRLRSSSQERYFERVRKEALHEVGHLLGLGHCRVRECVMSFSNSVFEVDLKSEKFCYVCATKLSHLGVRVSHVHRL